MKACPDCAEGRAIPESSILGVRKRTLDDQVGPEHTHGRDTDTSLSGTVGSTEAGEDDGGSATHRSEERLLWHVSKFLLPCVCILIRLLSRRPDSEEAIRRDGALLMGSRSRCRAVTRRKQQCSRGWNVALTAYTGLEKHRVSTNALYEGLINRVEASVCFPDSS